jgi:hypothetical protein
MFITRLLAKSTCLILLLPFIASSDTITWLGPRNPATGLVCDPQTEGNCVIGDPLEFNISSASLTSPDIVGDNWKLEIQTNYGTPLPGGSVVIPTFAYEGKQFGMADFMIEWGGNFYGVILSAHDGYTAGNLYKADGFQTSGQVMGAAGVINIPRPNLFALLNPNGQLQGAGVITALANPGADGVTQALYEVSVEFAAPVGFLGSGTFTIYASSYVCDNGYITGDGDAFPPGEDEPPSEIPEPPTSTLAIPLCVALALRKLSGLRKE